MKLHTPSLLLGALLTSCLVLGGLGLGSNSASAIAKPVAKDQIRPADLKRPAAAPAASYTTRGEVVALPEKGKPNTELMVKHQAIDDFKNKDGKVVGMSAMTMEFPPEKGIDVTIMAIGDKVELEFAVWWAQSPPWLATKLTKLPADTKLEFRRADITRANAPVKAEVPAPADKPVAKPAETTASPMTPITPGAQGAQGVTGEMGAPAAAAISIDRLDAAVDDGKAAIVRAALAKLVPGGAVESVERDEEYPDEIAVYNVQLTTKATADEPETSHMVLLTDAGTVLLHSKHGERQKFPAELAAFIKAKHPQAKIVHADATISYEWLVQFKDGKNSFVALMSSGGDFQIEEGDNADDAIDPAAGPDPVPVPAPAPPKKKAPGF